MGAGTFPDAWQEVAIITICPKGGTELEFTASTETLDLPQGDYPFESIPNMAGGRIGKQSPEEDGEIILELYPIDASVADNTSLMQQFAGVESDDTYDTAQPMATNTTFTASIFDVRRQRTKFMIAVLWTDDITQDSAMTIDAVGTTAKVALRFYAKDCRMTALKNEYTDGILKSTATFKYPAMNKAGTEKLWAWESSNDMLTSGSAELPDLTYT